MGENRCHEKTPLPTWYLKFSRRPPRGGKEDALTTLPLPGPERPRLWKGVEGGEPGLQQANCAVTICSIGPGEIFTPPNFRQLGPDLRQLFSAAYQKFSAACAATAPDAWRPTRLVAADAADTEIRQPLLEPRPLAAGLRAGKGRRWPTLPSETARDSESIGKRRRLATPLI